MGRRLKTISSNLATTSNQNYFSWDSVKLANFFERKRLMSSSVTPEQMHDMNAWSVYEVVIKRRENREQHPEIINLDSDMAEGRSSQLK